MKIDYDEESKWPGFRWKVTGIKWFGKKMIVINYGWFGSKESAILWCSKQGMPYSFPA